MESKNTNKDVKDISQNYSEEISSEISFPISGYNDNLTVEDEKFSKLIDYYESRL